ncbi:MAG: hypothetical protein IIY96_01615, partial [Lachnospiraceae bacterium]|nr:hypothetical protein [Lachnospiraceae bacterium]
AGAAFGPVVSPEVKGYKTETVSVRSGADGMPARDVEIDVVYEADRRKGGSETTGTDHPEPDKDPDEPAAEPGSEPAETAGEPADSPTAGPEITVPSGGTPGTGTGGGSQAIASLPAASESSMETDTFPSMEEEQTPAYMKGARLVFYANDEPALEMIEDTEVPLANLPLSYGYWALINLLAAIATVFFSLILLPGVFKRREDEEEEENEKENKDQAGGTAGSESSTAADTTRSDITNAEAEGSSEAAEAAEEEPEEEEKTRNRRLLRLCSLIPAIASVIIFIRTEDMTNAMRLVDGWTILMIFILAVQLILAFLCRKKKQDDDEEEEKSYA